jgi:hypothetical protein
MQKSFSVAIFLFGLSMNAPAHAQEARIQRNLPSDLSHTQSLMVANMVPENLPDNVSAPTAVVNANVQAIDSNKIMPKSALHSQSQSAANSDAQTVTPQARAMSATEEAQLKNYAPFMRTMVMSASMMGGGNSAKNMKATRVMRGNKQVIVLGGS